jgi:hypothetical protein
MTSSAAGILVITIIAILIVAGGIFKSVDIGE